MDITQSFDFVHCVSYFSYSTGLVLNKFALESILAKELKYIGTFYPVSCLIRMNKFVSKGWRISNSEILKIAYDLSQKNLDSKKVLIEQTEMHGMTPLFENLQSGYDRNDLFALLNN